jgi:type I restriction enzyme S subunit
MDGSLVGRSYARLSETDLPAVLLQRVARIRSETIDIGFLTQFIGSDRFIKYCDSVKTVTAIPHISSADIRNFSIPLPPSKAEQIAIAEVLSDMDAELAALEQRRAKTHALKQGMMQELLTGRTRLV